MGLVYNWGIYGMILAFRIAALFNPKAKLWIKGRENWRHHLAGAIQDWPDKQHRIWMHCASLGEFEQGRPLIEKMRADTPDLKLILTFFSPSGFEIRKNYPAADVIVYLPADTSKNARDFIKIVQPDSAIFVKYEFWFNYLKVLRQQQIPHFLIAGLFRPGQHFFQNYGAWFRKGLRGFTHFFLQNQASVKLLEQIDIQTVSLAGDPRIDRVLNIAKHAPQFPEIEAFIQGRKVLVAGSTWPPDEERLLSFIREHLFSNWCVLLAPHDISAQHLQELEQKIPVAYTKYSELKNGPKKSQVLLIDNIGMLSALYQYGKIAYIGGGFGQGIHNTLEPMAFQLPVIFGPKYQKFTEARFLVDQKAGFTYQTSEQLKDYFFLLQDPELYAEAAQKIAAFLQQNAGATALIDQFGKEKGYW